MEAFPTMEEFAQQYGIAIGDPNLKRQYQRFYDAQLEYNDIMYCAREYAMEQGMKQGLEQGLAQGLEQGLEQALNKAANP